MTTLRINHPDIFEFIRAKHNEDRLKGMNLSVLVTDKFMECLKTGEPFPLEFEGRIYKTVNPNDLWELLMRSTWEWAEPGVIFIDTVNRMNNLYYAEEISCTNPCGEQPLPPYGACLLGSHNLPKYIKVDDYGERYFDYALFKKDIPSFVRALDNVIDRTNFPLPPQEVEAKSKRRLGIGVTGLANAGEALGFPYGSEKFLAWEAAVLRVLLNECYKASALLAKEKGTFPLYHAEEYMAGEFVNSGVLDADTILLMRKYGMRNSHLTSMAPTGTISLDADNVSSGVEPVFGLEFQRTVQSFSGQTIETVQDYGYRVFGVKGRVCADVTASEHVAVLCTAQKYTDSAVSKTCNVSPDMPWEDFNPGGKRGGILVVEDKETTAKVDIVEQLGLDLEPEPEPVGEACSMDEVTGRWDCG